MRLSSLRTFILISHGGLSPIDLSPCLILTPQGNDALRCGYLSCCAFDDARAWRRRRTRGRDTCEPDASARRPERVAHLVQNMADDRRDAPGIDKPAPLTGARIGCHVA